MIPVVWNEELKADYQRLFNQCVVTPNRVAETDIAVRLINANLPRYKSIAEIIGCPSYLIGIMHNLECSSSFNRHLHNGDFLIEPTIHTPPGRPWTARPWNWSWEVSAIDALRLLHFNEWHDWSVAGMLYNLEKWNGEGYRMYHPECLTPYLWAATNLYTNGKYMSDGKFNPNLVSQQVGAAPLIKRGTELGLFVE